MTFSATVLASKSDGIGPSLLLRCCPQSGFSSVATTVSPALCVRPFEACGGQEYIFNLPESLHRLASSHGVSPKQLAAVFVPDASFDSVVATPGRPTSTCTTLFLAGRFSEYGPLPAEFKKAQRVHLGFDRVASAFEQLGSYALRSAQIRVLCPNYTENCYEDSEVAVCGLCSGTYGAKAPHWLRPNESASVIDLLSSSDGEATEVIELSSEEEQDLDSASNGSLEDSESTVLPEVHGHKRRRTHRMFRKMNGRVRRTRFHNARFRAQGTQQDVAKTIIAGLPCHQGARKFAEGAGTVRQSVSSPAPNAFQMGVSRKGKIYCFFALLKRSQEMIVVVFLRTQGDLEKLKSHTWWGSVRFPGRPVRAIFHLSRLELMKTERYKKWTASLPGEQVIVDWTLGEGCGWDVGLHRVLDRGLRLRVAAERHFPLPASFLRPPRNQGTVFAGPLSSNALTSLVRRPERTTVATLLTSVRTDGPKQPLVTQASPLQAVCPGTFGSETLRMNARLRSAVELNAARCLDLEYPIDAYLPLIHVRALPATDRNGIDLRDRWPSVQDVACRLAADGGVPPCLVQMAEQEDPGSILFLGTGCAEPSPWRGSSAILIRVGAEQKGILLDCGEGTYGQLIRYLGEAGAREAVNKLECVWISHRHVDHCAGVGALLSKRSALLPPVEVFCPNAVRRFLHKAGVSCICHGNAEMENGVFDRLRSSLGVSRWQSFRVEHGIEAYGIRIDWVNAFSLVYSGDTRPCAQLEKEALNCTLLVHESTHACVDLKNSQSTKHSTWAEALNIAARTNAYRTMLTHFSRRYPGLPDGLTTRELGSRAAVAFDGMLVKFIDLIFLPVFNEAIEEALKEVEFGGDLVSSEEDDYIDLTSESSDDE